MNLILRTRITPSFRECRDVYNKILNLLLQSLRNESFAIINLADVSTKLNSTVFAVKAYKELIRNNKINCPGTCKIGIR